MTSWQSLLHCAQADVTLERIRNLIATTGTEPLTVDFKKGSTPRIAECAASMANAYGGLIIVGVTDEDREIVGVPREAMAHVADVLATYLEPPDWQPEMIEVALADKPGKYILVLRINRDIAPRPVFVQVTAKSGGQARNVFCAPVRIPGGTRQATRNELHALFTELQPAGTQQLQWDLNRPDIPSHKTGGKDPAVDFVLLSGLRVPASPAAWGRPISQQLLQALATQLDRSVLPGVLLAITRMGNGFTDSFRQEGHNRSHTANLAWRLLPGEPPPFEMTAHIEVPGHYGLAHIGEITFTLTIASRLTTTLRTGKSTQPPPPGPRRWLDTPEWAALLDALIQTLTSPDITRHVADLADIDPIAVPNPASSIWSPVRPYPNSCHPN